MSLIRKLLGKAKADDGMSLIEVVVAMMIFALVAAGVAYSTIIVARITDDTGSRQVATNLATTEIDYIRSLQDPFLIKNDKKTVTVGAINYYIVRQVSWVDAAGTDVGCGTGSG